MMRWEDPYDEPYDADDPAEFEPLKTRLLIDLKAHRLAQACKSCGLTRREVAEAMGLSVGRVSQIQRDEVTSVDVLGRYADAVGGRLQQIVLLVAGDKAGDWRGWYRRAIPQAEQLYAEHIEAMSTGGAGDR